MHHLALVDDHILLRQGLTALINTFGNFKVLFEADNGKDFIRQLKPSSLPELVLMDITMQEMDGYATTQWLKVNHPQVKVLALSMMDDEKAIIRILKCGAKGYILKNTKPSELLAAMQAVINKGFYFNELINGRLINSINKSNDTNDEAKDGITITEREREFLSHVCSEDSYKEIAVKMFVAYRTVDGYRETLFSKLKIKSRVGLAIYAIKSGIVEI